MSRENCVGFRLKVLQQARKPPLFYILDFEKIMKTIFYIVLEQTEEAQVRKITGDFHKGELAQLGWLDTSYL